MANDAPNPFAARFTTVRSSAVPVTAIKIVPTQFGSGIHHPGVTWANFAAVLMAAPSGVMTAKWTNGVACRAFDSRLWTQQSPSQPDYRQYDNGTTPHNHTAQEMAWRGNQQATPQEQ